MCCINDRVLQPWSLHRREQHAHARTYTTSNARLYRPNKQPAFARALCIYRIAIPSHCLTQLHLAIHFVYLSTPRFVHASSTASLVAGVVARVTIHNQHNKCILIAQPLYSYPSIHYCVCVQVVLLWCLVYVHGSLLSTPGAGHAPTPAHTTQWYRHTSHTHNIHTCTPLLHCVYCAHACCYCVCSVSLSSVASLRARHRCTRVAMRSRLHSRSPSPTTHTHSPTHSYSESTYQSFIGGGSVTGRTLHGAFGDTSGVDGGGAGASHLWTSQLHTGHDGGSKYDSNRYAYNDAPSMHGGELSPSRVHRGGDER